MVRQQQDRIPWVGTNTIIMGWVMYLLPEEVKSIYLFNLYDPGEAIENRFSFAMLTGLADIELNIVSYKY